MPERLTVKVVRDAKAREREYIIYDTEIRGLGLRVSPGGAKSWTLQYKAKSGRVRRLSLGTVDDLTLHQARAGAKRERECVVTGGDPARERRKAREAWTVKTAWERFVLQLQGKRAASTIREYEMVYRCHVGPALGSRPVSEVTWPHAADLLEKIGRQAPVQSNRTGKCSARVFDYAAKMGQYPPELRNPWRGHDRFPERHTAGRCYSRDELRAIGEALDAEPAGSLQAAALRVAFLSGWRPGEVVALRWEDLSEDLRVAKLPASKTGPRTAYLGRPAVGVVAALPRVCEYVFPSRLGRGSAPLGDVRFSWDRVRARAGIEGRAYDARHTYVTTAEETLGIPRDRVAALVGHSPGGSGVHGKYVHRADLRLIADADRVAEWIDGAMRGEVVEAEVLRFKV